MNKDIQNIYRHLMSERPTFLFLGQDYLRLETGEDPLLTSTFAKYGIGEDSNDLNSADISYPAVFEKCSFDDQNSARTWISGVSQRLVSPSWLEIVASMSWSGVYSSSMDTLLIRAFRNDWRNVQPVFSKKFSPPDPRSRTNLHVTYLFGCVEREDEDELSPLDESGYIRRLPDSINLLSRLKEQTTPLGLILIDGYRSERDWLTSRDLATLALTLEKEQIHIFSVTDGTKEDVMIRKLTQSKQVILHEQSLAKFLADGAAFGLISFEPKKEFRKNGHYISLGNSPRDVPENIWAITSRSATILDNSIISPPSNFSEEGRYRAFRNFLFESGTHAVWNAYPSGFALDRDFEKDLLNTVHTRLRRRSFGGDPIILHGQTGTGKSVALGALAYKIRSEHQYTVIFIERRPQSIVLADLDQFCKWAEDSGFPATLIVWDAMGQIEQYSNLQKYLLGRGRNVVIVGSSYKLEPNGVDQKSLVLAPPNLSEEETARFKSLLARFEPSLGEQLDGLLKKKDNTFLVALYRLLPDTRGQVKYGLQRETGAAEIAIKEQASQIQPEFSGGALLAAFQKSGFLNSAPLLPNEDKKIGGEIYSTTEELVGLIMVPGRFGLKVPIELVIRSLGRSKVANFHMIFDSVDIFRWHADDQGNIFLGTRHPLEAKLIAQARLGGPRQEVEFAKKLLIEVDEFDGRSENSQIQFAADLLRNMGPNGPERKLYSTFYEDIANCLLKLRTERGIQNPRIMLQEASLLREAVVAIPSSHDDINKRLDLLDRAIETLRVALSGITADFRTRRIRAMLLVELASTLGTKVRELLKGKNQSEVIMDTFYEARTYAVQARTLQPEDFFPIDVMSWSTKDLIERAEIDDASRLEVVVDLMSTLETCDEQSMNIKDREIFNRRRAEFGNILSDDILKADALAKLEAMGSCAGYYLHALTLSQERSDEHEFSAEALVRFSAALTYLQENYAKIENDGRCMFLLLRYWWIVNSHKPLFGGERQLLPFDLNQWRYLINLLNKLMSIDEAYQTPSNNYLKAVATWSIGYFDDANELWKDLQRVSESVTGRRRVAKTYVSCEASGDPKIYNGTIDWIAEDGNRGQIFVEGIRQKVDFFPKDFGLTESHKGEAVNKFCISFNYIGPVADPLHHVKQ